MWPCLSTYCGSSGKRLSNAPALADENAMKTSPEKCELAVPVHTGFSATRRDTALNWPSSSGASLVGQSSGFELDFGVCLF